MLQVLFKELIGGGKQDDQVEVRCGVLGVATDSSAPYTPTTSLRVHQVATLLRWSPHGHSGHTHDGAALWLARVHDCHDS